MSTIRHIVNKHRKLILYGIIGASGAALDLCLFLFLFNVLHVNPLLATVISTSLGIANNFTLNVMFNFKVRDRIHHRFVLFYTVGLFGLILSVFIIYVLHDIGNISANIAKLVSIPIIVMIQYLINSRLSFSNTLEELILDAQRLIKQSWIDLSLLFIAFLTFCLSSFYVVATDDMDNMLGGKLIDRGQLPYIDFFSHHMPGMYFLSALLYPFTANNVFIYRLLFNAVLFVLLGLTYWLIVRRVTIVSARLFLVLFTLAHTIGLNHIAVAESLLAYVFALSFILILYPINARYSYQEWAVIAILLFCIPFFSLSYLFAGLILYALFAYREIRSVSPSPMTMKLKRILLFAGTVITPYLLLGVYLFTTHSLKDFMFDNLTFNSRYYGPMVGEQGGSVMHVFVNVLVNSLAQIALVMRSMFSLDYVVQFLILIAFALMAYEFWRRNKFINAIAVLTLPFLLDTRINAFNVGAIEGQPNQYALGAIVYLAMALLCASIAIPSIVYVQGSKATKQVIKPYVFTVAVLYLLIIPINLASVSAAHYNAGLSANTNDNYYDFAVNYQKNSPSSVINKLLSPNDYAWVGPNGFQDNLYLIPHRATHFTFFFPWLYACDKCRSEFLSELSAQQPKIIYWSSFNYNGKPYFNDVHDILTKNYFTVSDDRLQGYYFIKTDTQSLESRLQANGYKI